MRNHKFLKAALEGLKEQRNPKADLAEDPLKFVHRYSEKGDMEIAGIFASALAFGRVASFSPVIEHLMEEADRHGGPRRWVENFDHGNRESIKSVRYRWLKDPDIALLAMTLKEILHQYVSIESAFLQQIDAEEPDFQQALTRFVNTLRLASLTICDDIGIAAMSFKQFPRGFKFLLPTPQSGAACKRWNLYLRWMIREEYPDVGIWNLSKAKLRIPVDAHVHRLAWLLGVTSRTTADDKAVTEITEVLRRLDPSDPIRYDFSLSHLGISGDCKSQPIPQICSQCQLKNVCRISPYCEVE